MGQLIPLFWPARHSDAPKQFERGVTGRGELEREREGGRGGECGRDWGREQRSYGGEKLGREGGSFSGGGGRGGSYGGRGRGCKLRGGDLED